MGAYVPNPCPLYQNRYPSSLKSQSSALNSQPSALNPTPKKTILNPFPSTLNINPTCLIHVTFTGYCYPHGRHRHLRGPWPQAGRGEPQPPTQRYRSRILHSTFYTVNRIPLT